MFRLENVDFLIYLSAAMMFFALISALFHGLSREGHLKERIFEFIRNALVQFSAMLFALATAQYVLKKNVERQDKDAVLASVSKRLELEGNEKSVARAAIGDRLSAMDRALLRFEFKNKPSLTPTCLDNLQPTEYDVVFGEYKIDHECLSEISESINRFLSDFRQLDLSMRRLGEALRVSEDWVKSPYFSKEIGLDVLHDFQSIEEKIDYRIFVVNEMFDKLKSRNREAEPRYDEIKALSYANSAVNYFQKSSLVYLIMFCETFGDENAKREEIINRQKKFYISVKNPKTDDPHITNPAADTKSMSLTNFKQILLSNARDCQFEGESCELILDHLPIDRTILSP